MERTELTSWSRLNRNVKVSVGNVDESEGEGLFLISDFSAGDKEYFKYFEEFLQELYMSEDAIYNPKPFYGIRMDRTEGMDMFGELCRFELNTMGFRGRNRYSSWKYL